MIVVSLLLILVSGGLLVAGILRAEDPLVITSIGVSLLAAVALFVGIRQQREALARRAGSGGTAGRAAEDTGTSPAEASLAESPEAPGTAQTAHESVAAGGYATDEPSVPAMTTSALSAGTLPASALPADTRAVVGGGSVSTGGPAVSLGSGAASSADGEVTPEDGVSPEPSAADTGDAAAQFAQSDAPRGADEAELVDEDPPDEPAAELVMASEVSRLAELDSEVMVVDGRPRYHLRGCPHLIDKEDQALPVAEAIELGFTACSACSAATTLLAQVPRK